MTHVKELEQLEELKKMVGDLVKSKKRFNQLSQKRSDMCTSTHTARSIDKANANLDFHAIEYDKLYRDVHACAVDCGIASPRDNYEKLEYNPSAYHRYTYQPRIPLCRQ